MTAKQGVDRGIKVGHSLKTNVTNVRRWMVLSTQDWLGTGKTHSSTSSDQKEVCRRRIKSQPKLGRRFSCRHVGTLWSTGYVYNLCVLRCIVR